MFLLYLLLFRIFYAIVFEQACPPSKNQKEFAMKIKNKHCHSLLLQPKTKGSRIIHCEGLENRPVSHAELVVIETYANDLILDFIRDNKIQNKGAK